MLEKKLNIQTSLDQTSRYSSNYDDNERVAIPLLIMTLSFPTSSPNPHHRLRGYEFSTDKSMLFLTLEEMKPTSHRKLITLITDSLGDILHLDALLNDDIPSLPTS
ncbi:hypothetical protein Tco_0294352 [Tanacetum coccineum]